MLKAICQFLEIRYLYYLTDWRNLGSILRRGILCYNLIHSQGIDHHSFADENIQRRRATKSIRGKSAQDYVPLFFHFKPPMLYKLQKSYESHIAYICIDPIIIAEEGVLFTDKNLACQDCQIFDKVEELLNLKWDVIKNPYNYDLNARHIRGAEVLIPEKVELKWFQKIVVNDTEILKEIIRKFPVMIPIEVNPKYYY